MNGNEKLAFDHLYEMSNNVCDRDPLRITLSSCRSRQDKRPRSLIVEESSQSNIDPFVLRKSVRLDKKYDDDTKPKAEDAPINFDLLSLPNDIIMAIRSSSARNRAAYCPLITQHEPTTRLLPFILKPMLYHVFLSKPSAPRSQQDKTHDNDHINLIQRCASNAYTGVNTTLLESCQRNTVRQLVLLGTGNSDESTKNAEDDVAVMETEHYIMGVWDAYRSASSLKRITTVNNPDDGIIGGFTPWTDHRRTNHWTDEQCKQVIEWFISQLNSWTEMYVKYVDVDLAIKRSLDMGRSSLDLTIKHTNHNQPWVVGLPTHCTTQRVLDFLESIQILIPRIIPKVITSDSFWLTLPLLGQVSKALTMGRKQMLIQFKRSYHKELKQSTLQTKSFGDKNYKLSANFLVRDFLSRGIVKICETPSGEFVRLIQTNT